MNASPSDPRPDPAPDAAHDGAAQDAAAADGRPAPDASPAAAGPAGREGAGDIGDPAAGEGHDERLDARVVPAWILSGLVGVAVLGAFAAFALAAFADELGERFATVRNLAIAGFAALTLWSVVLPPLAWRAWVFRIGERLLLVRHGVVFHEEKAIPTSRLQHVDVTRGPIERAFGLATLVVFTAGSEGATLRLPGLTAARAAELRDRILQARGDDVL